MELLRSPQSYCNAECGPADVQEEARSFLKQFNGGTFINQGSTLHPRFSG